eukprot:TRINITY_DN2382_c0_g2_i2.p4 TRINITY_DN2382_c0_g2~~TRINITY_DN2382_c0_g2_i2.p4  ORF type:complete len:130 (-),score=31.24 TRINITY_DN2382_c0_g2_i2:308-697(-)
MKVYREDGRKERKNNIRGASAKKRKAQNHKKSIDKRSDMSEEVEVKDILPSARETIEGQPLEPQPEFKPEPLEDKPKPVETVEQQQARLFQKFSEVLNMFVKPQRQLFLPIPVVLPLYPLPKNTNLSGL